MRVKLIKALEATSKSATFNTDIDLEHAYGFCVAVVVSSGSGLTSATKLQASVDEETWVDVSGTSTNTSSDGSYMWNVVDAMYRHLRIVNTISAGSATYQIRVHTKGA